MTLMLAAVTIFACMDNAAKYLTAFYPVGTVVAGRYVFQALAMMAIFVPTQGIALVRTRSLKLQIVRGVLLAVSTTVFFTALSRMPIAEASAITFLSPILVAALSGPLLRERVPRAIWGAVALGFVGVALILRPGGGLFTPWALLPLTTALLFALYQVLTRRIAGRDPAITTLFYPAVIGAIAIPIVIPIVFPGALVLPATVPHALLMIALGVFGSVGHFLLIRAFELAPAATLAPLVYAQLPITAVIGFAVFAQFPDELSLVGLVIVAGSGLVLAARERFKR